MKELEQFKKIRRRIRAMERQGKIVPEELIEKHKAIDIYLSKNAIGWNPNYKHE